MKLGVVKLLTDKGADILYKWVIINVARSGN